MIRTNKDKVRKDQESCIQSVLYRGVTIEYSNNGCLYRVRFSKDAVSLTARYYLSNELISTL